MPGQQGKGRKHRLRNMPRMHGDGQQSARWVKTGLQDGARVQVVEGVALDESVLLAPPAPASAASAASAAAGGSAEKSKPNKAGAR